MLKNFAGATVRRTIDRSFAEVPAHSHDWPMLSIFVMGDYTNVTEVGEKSFAGPSAVLYGARAVHRNVVGPNGFEQIEIEFDPDWLGRDLVPKTPVSHWTGGSAGVESRRIARLCGSDITATQFRTIVRQFVEAASNRTTLEPPNWVRSITQRARQNATVRLADFAREVERHPSRLGATYHKTCGERLQETMARLRVERAARLLRETDDPLAQIAIEAGFCDQSHMNRTMLRVLGRLPTAVREDRQAMREARASA